jgi:hypothetical protein
MEKKSGARAARSWSVRPRYDASEIYDQGEAGNTVVAPAEENRHVTVYEGERARWAGTKGEMMELPASMIVPMPGNHWYPDRLVDYAVAIRAGVLFEPPSARIYIVSETEVEESPLEVADGKYDYPFEEEDIGEPYAFLIDGNHRAFAAILSGERSVWVHVVRAYLEDAGPWLR